VQYHICSNIIPSAAREVYGGVSRGVLVALHRSTHSAHPRHHSRDTARHAKLHALLETQPHYTLLVRSRLVQFELNCNYLEGRTFIVLPIVARLHFALNCHNPHDNGLHHFDTDPIAS